MALWGLIVGWWYARQRAIDVKFLWPICLEGAHDLDHAKKAFALHVFQDPAWLALGEKELFRFVDKLDRIKPVIIRSP